MKIFYEDSFKKWFEVPVKADGAGTFVSFTLAKNTSDGEIIAHLGGAEKAEVAPAEILWLISRQLEGGKGPLDTDGSRNVFYSRDQKGVLRPVAVHRQWEEDRWRVVGYAGDAGKWYAGTRIFHRAP